MNKLEIAADFVSLHKEFDESIGLDRIYSNLINGVYGEVRPTGFENEREVEISKHDSVTGNPILFSFN